MNERMTNRIIFALFLLLVLVTYLVITLTTPTASNARELSAALRNQQTGEIVSLKELTDFEWDSVYTFAPYTDKETICQVMGINVKESLETVNESMVQMIFKNGDEISCILLGYPDKLGYAFDYGVDGYDYLIFSASNEPQFRVERPFKHYLVLRYMPLAH